MKRKTLVVLLLTFFMGCGGGGSDDPLQDVTGRWTGTVQFNEGKSCSPDESLDLSGRTYVLDLAPLEDDGRKVVVDQDNVVYEQFYPEGIEDGEFSVNSTAHDIGVGTPTGPTAISFPPNDGRSAVVELFVTYNRFCTAYFSGQFRRE